MNTARLKNIVILILLLANAFLLVLLFSRRAEENAAHERSVAQLTALLNADGIAFDSALLDGLPDTVLSVQPARDLAAEQALAEGIIGSVTSIDSGGGIYRYYSSDGLNSGSCLIRSGGALETASGYASAKRRRSCRRSAVLIFACCLARQTLAKQQAAW